jgi:hypothetical protein
VKQEVAAAHSLVRRGTGVRVQGRWGNIAGATRGVLVLVVRSIEGCVGGYEGNRGAWARDTKKQQEH